MKANQKATLIINPAKNVFEQVIYLKKTNFGWARIRRQDGSTVSVPFDHLF